MVRSLQGVQVLEAREAMRTDNPRTLAVVPAYNEAETAPEVVRSLHRDAPGVDVVVIDEAHAFVGDDRGWHLLAVLARVSKLAGRELQRIAL